jgi:excinuclease ABC subunit B
VSLVAILDADKEGFLRSARSLIQTCGRAARNAQGMVVMYADTITPSMRQCIDETERRRKIQKDYNKEHHITPVSIQKEIKPIFDFGDENIDKVENRVAETVSEFRSLDDVDSVIKKLEKQMDEAARDLEFEKAADLRDQIRALQKLIVMESSVSS